MFIKEVRVLPAAVADIESASAFYEGRQPGTSDIFWDCLLADLDLLMLCGGINAKKSGFHRMLAKRFPYAIYYRVKDDVAYIAAVLPMRRDPTWIKQQLERR
jgi:plasmid stabilization system protein ParE